MSADRQRTSEQRPICDKWQCYAPVATCYCAVCQRVRFEKSYGQPPPQEHPPSNPVAVPADRLNEYWRRIFPDGMTIEQVCNELHDLEFLAGAVPHVYCHVTGGMISKPNTLPEVVCSVHDDHVSKLVEEAIEEDREDRAADVADGDRQ